MRIYEFTLDVRLVAFLSDDLERPMLHVRDNGRVIHLATDQTLGVEHSVDRVHSSLILGSIADQALGFRESDPRRGGTVTLIISNDLNTLILPDADAGVRGSQIDTNGGPINFLLKVK